MVRIKRLFPFTILIFLIVLFFYDILFLGKTLSTSPFLLGSDYSNIQNIIKNENNIPFSFDIAGNAYVNEPNPYIIRRILDEEKIPLWNFYEGLGIPLIGNLNTEVFNPLKIILNLFPDPYLQDIFFLLRILFMGIFTYLFLQELKLSNLSCLFGSSFFMLSGYSVWWINLHPLSTVMYIPAVFYFYEKWSNRNDIKYAFLMSLFLASAFIGGKTPEVIMGVCFLFSYAIWKRLSIYSIKDMLDECLKVCISVFISILIALFVLLPFIELYIHASPIAKSIRTGASCPTLPLISSVSLMQPLFLGFKNYFYTSWLKWEPDMIMPHASIIVFVFLIYTLINRNVLKNVFSFFILSFIILLLIFGILPTSFISWIPVMRSIELLKYNAMVYFSLAIISASALEDFLSKDNERKKINSSIIFMTILLVIYFYFLNKMCPFEIKRHLLIILVSSILFLFILFLLLNFIKKRQFAGMIILLLLIVELFMYMPKNHPERFYPYAEQPYFDILKDKMPYRIIGSGNALPPLTSNALGIYDLRTINVLLPGDYYTFFENLVSFSVPYTNSPDPLFSATSPFIDILGVRYILSKDRINTSNLEQVVKTHVNYVRWIRFFNSMISHSIKGVATYGFFEKDGKRRFCLFFSKSFTFKIRLRVSEPYIFAHFTMKDHALDVKGRIKILIGNEFIEEEVDGGRWKDVYLDVSKYKGKVIDLIINGEGDGDIVLGDFGLSPGKEKEKDLTDKLLKKHKDEVDSIEFKGMYNNLYIYENKNVMDRAFMLYKTMKADNLKDVINKLQDGINFRDTALINVSNLKLNNLKVEDNPEGKVQIVRYTPNEVDLKVKTRGGLLVLSDLYYPGWKVKVNGKEEEIIKVFGVLRGVFLKQGENKVIFYYKPLSFYLGLIVSICTIVVWLIYFLRIKRKMVRC